MNATLNKSDSPVAKRLLIAAGGTGGHIFPGLAVADVLRTRGWQIAWLGAQGGLEEQLVPKRNIPLHCLPITGARGKNLMTRVRAPFRLLASVWRAHRIIREFAPHAVLGMGGYASGPGGLAAWLWRTPLVIHEQNAVAGLTNRVLAYVATRALCAFPGALAADRVVGNPVRNELIDLPAPEQRLNGRSGALRVLVVGGSRGAQALNNVLPEALALCNRSTRPQLWHQTGAGQLAAVDAHYRRLGLAPDGEALRVSEFIDDMAAAYAWADLVICRAGALTVSEVAAAGVAALFVPYPHAVDDHQTRNADYLVSQQAGWLLPQQELTAEKLAAKWQELHDDRDTLRRVAVAARRCAQRNAAAAVAEVIAEVAGEHHG